jgi:hypothetical protein
MALLPPLPPLCLVSAMAFPSQRRVIALGLSFAPWCLAHSSPSFICLLPSLSLCLSVLLSLCLSVSLARSLSLSLSLSLATRARALSPSSFAYCPPCPFAYCYHGTQVLAYIYIHMNSPTCDIYMNIYIICNIYTYELTYLPSHSILVSALAGACISAMPAQAPSRTRYWPMAHHVHQYLLCLHPQQRRRQQPLRPPPASSHHEP